eukprot:CAMPEP_0172706412 /NCGR_PEP_ID=MMETSP1074-20121228/45986_1 /TAXON_ID=2916 /ORGANISM="Ceratium fusus, Strain PA161109" /LENGTH=136 /DNA_ID=CAMNT_0013528983 /DNA_START=14 /DNA_END=421 /DNA_ORIENTATION=+
MPWMLSEMASLVISGLNFFNTVTASFTASPANALDEAVFSTGVWSASTAKNLTSFSVRLRLSWSWISIDKSGSGTCGKKTSACSSSSWSETLCSSLAQAFSSRSLLAPWDESGDSPCIFASTFLKCSKRDALSESN